MPRTLELAFLGAGDAARAHARSLTRLGASVGLTFASRDRARAVAAARDRPGVRVAASYEEALDGSADAVVLTTPPSTHRELALRALAAGKHVVVEKPAFPAPADFDVVADVARAAGRLVLVAENYRHKPAVRRVRRLVGAGAVGDVLAVAVTAHKRQPLEGWRAEPALAGGGPLMEGGVHWVALMTELGLTATDVTAHRAGPGDSLVLVFTYAEGPVGTLTFSWHAWSPLGGARLSRVFGTAGSIAFESNGAFVAAFGRRPSVAVVSPRELSGQAQMWRDLLAALGTGEDPLETFARGRRDVELVARAYAQLAQGSMSPRRTA